MAKTASGIEWTDATWNPMTGCTAVSRGCDNCYAARLAETKLRALYTSRPALRGDDGDAFAPRFWEDRLKQPLRWRKPKRIFVNSMSDVFHAHFSVDQIRAVFEVIEKAHWHQFQLLTKRPVRAARLAADLPWPSNLWIGTSVEDTDALGRLDHLRRLPAAVRFLSAEPLLGPLDGIDLQGIHWVIGGGESGPGHRPTRVEWAVGLRDACLEAGVAFFWKQWGGPRPKSGGRELDGRTWDEYPARTGALRE